MSPTTRGSQALNQAMPVARDVLAALRPVWQETGNPSRPDEGHYEVDVGSLVRLDSILQGQVGLPLVRNDGEARPGELRGGRQLFYFRGNLCVRVKTRGTPFRARPHLTLSMVDVRPEATPQWHIWDRERVKFDGNGHPAWKNMSDGNLPPNVPSFSFPTRIVDGLTAGDKDRWADDCHFDLPSGFDATGEATLQPGP